MTIFSCVREARPWTRFWTPRKASKPQTSGLARAGGRRHPATDAAIAATPRRRECGDPAAAMDVQSLAVEHLAVLALYCTHVQFSDPRARRIAGGWPASSDRPARAGACRRRRPRCQAAKCPRHLGREPAPRAVAHPEADVSGNAGGLPGVQSFQELALASMLPVEQQQGRRVRRALLGLELITSREAQQVRRSSTAPSGRDCPCARAASRARGIARRRFDVARVERRRRQPLPTISRLKLDEPTNLPEGQVIELIPLDEVISTDGDDLDDEERAALHRSIDESIEDEEAGNVEDLSKIIAELRAQL